MLINKVDTMAKIRNCFVPGQTTEELVTMGYEGILEWVVGDFQEENPGRMPPPAVMELIAMEILKSARREFATTYLYKPPSGSKL